MCCIHREKWALLPWHRLYMAQMEEELGEPLPYWDWTANNTVPDLWEGMEVPMKPSVSSQRPNCNTGKPLVARKQGIDIKSTDLKIKVAHAFASEQYDDDLTIHIKTPHDDVHTRMDCHMYSTMTSGYDPVFYLHHTFIDYIWAYWQELQKHRKKEVDYGAEFDQPLAPFHKADFNKNEKTLQNSKGRDVVDYQNSLCYEYDEFLFDGNPPSEFQHKDYQEKKEEAGFEAAAESGAFANSNDGTMTESEGGGSGEEKGPRLGKCKKVCKEDFCRVICAADKDGKHFVKVFVGVVLPKKATSGENVFSLCQEDKCVKDAGEVSTFGGEESEIPVPENVDGKEFYISEIDVTSVMEREGLSFLKPLEAKITSSAVPNLPDPVVITKKIGKSAKGDKGTVIFPTKDKRQRYGNLLDKYSSS